MVSSRTYSPGWGHPRPVVVALRWERDRPFPFAELAEPSEAFLLMRSGYGIT